jgi:hypothetical protein
MALSFQSQLVGIPELLNKAVFLLFPVLYVIISGFVPLAYVSFCFDAPQ